jgi:uncharacterized protein YjbI with pentapeptide repeats/energy-coupling factor transporter ATP-binding protein EcfA2
VLSEDSGALPLEDEIQELVTAGHTGVVYLLGSPGSGKSTALQHLAAVMPADTRLVLLDEFEPWEGTESALVVRAVSTWPDDSSATGFALASWGDDELIEYLLAVHHVRCASVMSRIGDADRELLQGIPELWRIVLDQMADEPDIPGARTALHRHLQIQLLQPNRMAGLRRLCLAFVARPGKLSPTEYFAAAKCPANVVRVVRHVEVGLPLAAEGLAEALRDQPVCAYLEQRLPFALVQSAGAAIAGDGPILHRLRALLEGPTPFHAMSASLLHAAGGFIPAPGQVPVLAGAYLDGAEWEGVKLPGVDLGRAELRNANLRGANLDWANAGQADLNRACLSESSLHGFTAHEADLTGADLTLAQAVHSHWEGANLTGATFACANLTWAVFSGATLDDADFSGATLHRTSLARLPLHLATFRGACFTEADMSGCDMEGMELAGVDARQANLKGALLTDAVLTDANLEGACLRETGLGDVNMERANLRGADLSGATFHMGSSRSGMLITPIASEGTRTGFYTDDADEQNFKSPEEIRKANLRGADLRGAKIEDVDFYLVDLRDALYDADQEQHFRRCRAILESPQV